jgi:hypothetical protein
MFQLLNKMRKVFGLGGKARIRFTLPPTIFETHKFALRFAEQHRQEQNIVHLFTILGK